MQSELEELNEQLSPLTARSNFEHSLGYCLENMFKITQQCQKVVIEGTSIQGYCYFLSPRISYSALIEKMEEQILNFVIPRTEIDKYRYKEEYTSEILALQRRAKTKFIDYYQKRELRRKHTKTKKQENGEAGELLLFMLLEQVAKLPQAICKMNSKSNNKMPVFGSDGIHVGLTEDKQKLALYFCEAKVYKKWKSAIKDCLSSLAPILSENEESIETELNLLTSYCDLGEDNIELVNKLKEYFKRTQKRRDFSEIRGACLIAFDCLACSKKDSRSIACKISEEIELWFKTFHQEMKKYNIEHIFVHAFFLPMESIVAFRRTFANIFKGRPNETHN